MTDTALLLQNPVLLALQLVAHRGTLSRSVAELGMAQRALVLVEGVLTAPETLWIFELRVTDKAAIFITVMLRTPQASGIPQTRVADKTVGIRKIVARAACALHFLVTVAIDTLLQRRFWRRVSSTPPGREDE
jgi:ribosomal protein L31E